PHRQHAPRAGVAEVVEGARAAVVTGGPVGERRRVAHPARTLPERAALVRVVTSRTVRNRRPDARPRHALAGDARGIGIEAVGAVGKRLQIIADTRDLVAGDLGAPILEAAQGAGVARVADAVLVGIALRGVEVVRAVVAHVPDAVPIAVGLRRVEAQRAVVVDADVVAVGVVGEAGIAHVANA